MSPRSFANISFFIVVCGVVGFVSGQDIEDVRTVEYDERIMKARSEGLLWLVASQQEIWKYASIWA